MKKRYFGTDGIRGRVGEAPITADFILKLGWAAGRVFAADGGKTVLIGKDTRLSGYMFESALEAGLSAAGVHSRLLGPMPTPAIAYLTRTLRASAGIVISASHNPHEDNGIKFFSAAGQKLDDETELAIEAELAKPMRTVASEQLGRAARLPDAPGRYIEFCKRAVSPQTQLGGIKLVLDCANGATYQVAPSLFHELGADVVRMGSEPDGLNINVNCGSVHPEGLARRVLAEGADAGVAFDGDGDRLIMVDEHGEVLDGDELLYIIACARHREGALRGPVVGTLMSNLGLEQALAQRDVRFLRAKVGDRYVMELLQAHGGMLGGESSGHLICLDRTTTGDGMVSALQVLEIMQHSGQSLHQLKQGMRKYPQHMINVPIARGEAPHDADGVREAVRAAEAEMGERGRVLLRPSGTEPVVRVMVECEDGEQGLRCCQRIAELMGATALQHGAAVVAAN